MTDRDALLAAIIANPDEDTPRLAYADLIQEAGEEERAEFIRVQCELARMGHTHEDLSKAMNLYARYLKRAPVALNAKTPATLLLRVHIALENHAWNWMGQPSFCVVAGGFATICDTAADGLRGTAEFRRGFVEHITCTAADWLAHADGILKQHPVRKVVLTTRPYRMRFVTVGNHSHRVFLLPEQWHAEEPYAMFDTVEQVANELARKWGDEKIEFELPRAVAAIGTDPSSPDP